MVDSYARVLSDSANAALSNITRPTDMQVERALVMTQDTTFDTDSLFSSASLRRETADPRVTAAVENLYSLSKQGIEFLLGITLTYYAAQLVGVLDCLIPQCSSASVCASTLCRIP
jgi:hypothetical protein